MLTNPPIPYDLCVGVPISRLRGLMPIYHSVLNMKALVGAFNQEKALVGALSVIVKTDGSFAALTSHQVTRRHIPEMDEIKTGEQTCDKNPKLLSKFQPF